MTRKVLEIQSVFRRNGHIIRVQKTMFQNDLSLEKSN